jgi:integrase
MNSKTSILRSNISILFTKDGGLLRRRALVDHRFELKIPKAKAGPRVQPITERLAKLLRAKRAQKLEETGQGSGWIFPSPVFGEERHRVSYAPMFKAIVVAADLNPSEVTPYTVRRTSITDVAASKIDLNGLMRNQRPQNGGVGVALRSHPRC